MKINPLIPYFDCHAITNKATHPNKHKSLLQQNNVHVPRNTMFSRQLPSPPHPRGQAKLIVFTSVSVTNHYDGPLADRHRVAEQSVVAEPHHETATVLQRLPVADLLVALHRLGQHRRLAIGRRQLRRQVTTRHQQRRRVLAVTRLREAVVVCAQRNKKITKLSLSTLYHY